MFFSGFLRLFSRSPGIHAAGSGGAKIQSCCPMNFHAAKVTIYGQEGGISGGI
ncbi:hypothetical protein APS_1347 [Acetobacter pasteurianus subsp. pasteurianus LMG 1262 = NBRC 106471]|nr:hypothetical protein APS_1347 [Acetobacter pasteurianus subsp. pasteurianus LMG 1262 = NBRC 106471]